MSRPREPDLPRIPEEGGGQEWKAHDLERVIKEFYNKIDNYNSDENLRKEENSQIEIFHKIKRLGADFTDAPQDCTVIVKQRISLYAAKGIILQTLKKLIEKNLKDDPRQLIYDWKESATARYYKDQKEPFTNSEFLALQKPKLLNIFGFDDHRAEEVVEDFLKKLNEFLLPVIIFQQGRGEVK